MDKNKYPKALARTIVGVGTVMAGVVIWASISGQTQPAANAIDQTAAIDPNFETKTGTAPDTSFQIPKTGSLTPTIAPATSTPTVSVPTTGAAASTPAQTAAPTTPATAVVTPKATATQVVTPRWPSLLPESVPEVLSND